MRPTPAQDYADLEIRIDPLRGDRYPVTLVVDGTRQFSGHLDASILPWVASYSPEQDGERLFDRLFATPDLRAGWGGARTRIRRRTRLAISREAPELHAIPWELLREHSDSYSAVTLAAAGDTPLSRYLYGGWEPGQAVRGWPVRMLVAIANPGGLEKYKLQPIELEAEWRAIQAAASQPGMELELLPQPCTLSALVDKVAERFHILHLVCHGAYSREDNQAVLFLADDDNQVRLVNDQEVAGALRNCLPIVPEKDRLRLVFLASCETATRSPADAFRGLAPQLVDAGVPVVLAMQDQVPVDTARAFAAEFYARLLQHGLVDLASNQARAHVIAQRLPGPSIPVLFMRLGNGRLLEVRSPEGRASMQSQSTSQHRHLRTVLEEQQRSYNDLTAHIGALDTDLRRTLDSEQRLILEDRRNEKLTQREKVLARMEEIEQELAQITPPAASPASKAMQTEPAAPASFVDTAPAASLPPANAPRPAPGRYADLQRDLANGEVCVFVGAGLSVGAGLPGWYQLIASLAQGIGHDLPEARWANGDMLIDAAQAYVNREGLHSLVRHLKDKLDTTGKSPTAAHHALAALPISLVFTANFDNLLERAYRDAGKRVEVVVKDSNVPFMRRGPEVVNIVKLYGDLDQPDTLVLAREQYERFFLDRPQLVRLLEVELGRSTMLYLGWSHSDPHFGLVFGQLLNKYKDFMRPGYAAMFDVSDAQKLELERKHLRLVQLPAASDRTAQLASWLQSLAAGTVP